ncbi:MULTISPECIES: Mov34/MPN/PAD-1 family protein [Vibrio]|uniref:Mov34/MPN/PAD-1 family protein n=1 Tax=Vibrio TaxID=662 RepID=UPI001B316183|nr:JAB domain-containing protein [Vibrio crassostreae]CAK3517105.1 JAB domain-containing protein [Vibrio crassostreae]
MPELITDDKAKTLVLLHDDVLHVLRASRQTTDVHHEAGGILIGEYRGDNINVLAATKPARGDIRSRFRFFRRSVHHQSMASHMWLNSNKTQTFVGDWHSHPEDHPTPSSIDINDWKRKLPNRKMIVVIQGRVSCWYGIWDGKSFTKGHLTE